MSGSQRATKLVPRIGAFVHERPNAFAVIAKTLPDFAEDKKKTDAFSEKTAVGIIGPRPTNANREASMAEQIVPPSGD